MINNDEVNKWSVCRLVTTTDESKKYICKFYGTDKCQYIKDGCMNCPIMQGILSKAADMEDVQQEVFKELTRMGERK